MGGWTICSEYITPQFLKCMLVLCCKRAYAISKSFVFLIANNALSLQVITFIPRMWIIFSGPLLGPNLISFCLISYPTPRQVFWISIYWRYLLIFDPLKFFIPRRWTILGGPLWGPPLKFFLVYFSPRIHFLHFNLKLVSAHFRPL